MVANGSGNWASQPYIVPQLGTFTDVLHDSISGQNKTITYSGTGDFSAQVNFTSRTVTAGQSTSYTVTFSSIGGFTGQLNLQALNWQLAGMSGSWSPSSVTVPSNSSVQATFNINTAANTPTGTINNIVLQGTNGSVTHAAQPVSLTVNPNTIALTGGISPSDRKGTGMNSS